MFAPAFPAFSGKRGYVFALVFIFGLEKRVTIFMRHGRMMTFKMKRWLSNLDYRIQYFMAGRYGYDELCRFLSWSALVLILLSYIPYLRFLYIVAFLLLIWACFRSFSKNIYKRRAERQKYLAARNRVIQEITLRRNIWRERKTHRYYKCSNCRAVVRIIKPEKGKTIAIRCPRCGQEMIKRT